MQEIGAPATSFVEHVEDGRVALQFFSTVMELPMCGHGTICLVTRLVDTGLVDLPDEGARTNILDLPSGEAKVEYHRNQMSRVKVMLDVAVARGDFVHLCLPRRDDAAMKALKPNFSGLASFCVAHGLETVAAFSSEVMHADQHLHLRDFCLAVGMHDVSLAKVPFG